MMGRALFIAGTDTDVGKTLICSLLLRQYAPRNDRLVYWKPVQTGCPPDDDAARVEQFSGYARAVPGECFSQPLSPHRAAELEGREIRTSDLLDRLADLRNRHDLLIEGAGGLCVPLNRQSLWTDFLAAAELPVLLVARTGLGTINHSLLSVEALQRRNIPVVGIAFCGPPNADNVKTVCDFTRLPVIGVADPRGEVDVEFDRHGLLSPFLDPRDG